MYKKHFGLKRSPFVLSPDPDFLYMSRIHDLALTHLEYGIVHNAGFLALTGDVGAGKTTLLKFLFEKVKDSLDIAMIFNTNLSPEAFLDMLVKEFELTAPSAAKSDLVEVLSNHFLKQYSSGRRCVIMVDEAQNLPDETFEELRMLSNLELGNDFLLQIVLVGQPQLRERLSQPSLSQLTQRISVYYHLSNLAREEVGSYVKHRLKVAGCNAPDSVFREDALKYIGEVSGGIPRVINSICDASLTYAFADELNTVTREIVEKVVQDNELLILSGKASAQIRQQDEKGKEGKRHTEPAQDSADMKSVLSKLYGRIQGLEMRMNALEAGQKDKLAEVLQEMLSREREKNILLEHKLTALSFKYKALAEELNAITTSERTEQDVREKKVKGFWNVFVGKK